MTLYTSTRQRQAMLWAIRRCEGTAGPNGYHTLVGGKLLPDLRAHPHRAVRLPGSAHIVSTAAGAYQFLSTTWDRVAHKLGLVDFSAPSQDQAALYLLDECGALRQVDARAWVTAAHTANRVWASLPGSPYGQRTVSDTTFVRFVDEWYKTHPIRPATRL